jgi:hypothetical protein
MLHSALESLVEPEASSTLRKAAEETGFFGFYWCSLGFIGLHCFFLTTLGFMENF